MRIGAKVDSKGHKASRRIHPKGKGRRNVHLGLRKEGDEARLKSVDANEEAGQPRQDAAETALTVRAQPRDPLTGQVMSPYSEEDKTLAVTLSFVTGSPARAGQLWGLLKGSQRRPDHHNVTAWANQGILPSPELAEKLTVIYRARLQGHYLEQELKTFDLAHEVTRSRLKNPDKKDTLFHLNGVLMTVADRTRQTLHPPKDQPGQTNLYAPGARFVSSGERKGWEDEVKEVKDGSGS